MNFDDLSNLLGPPRQIGPPPARFETAPQTLTGMSSFDVFKDLPMPSMQAPVADPSIEVPGTRIRYLSPSSLAKFETDPDGFVKQYVMQLPRFQQTMPMAIGSAFDCRVKAYLAAQLCGLNETAEFDRLYYGGQGSVDESLRKWAFDASIEVFERYKKSGALANLMIEVEGIDGVPQYEFDVSRDLVYPDGYAVPLFGKPDFFFRNLSALNIVLDWKVTGYMSRASPRPGYIRCVTDSGFNVGAHKDVFPIEHMGMRIAITDNLKDDWRTQLCLYQLMIDGDPNAHWVSGIEQLVFELLPDGVTRNMRVASYRARITPDFIESVRQRVRKAWECIQAKHYYPDRPKEESDNRVRILINALST